LNLKEYYRIEIYYPVLDIIIREMQHFRENQLDILNQGWQIGFFQRANI
jgi:hypothetical protein